LYTSFTLRVFFTGNSTGTLTGLGLGLIDEIRGDRDVLLVGGLSGTDGNKGDFVGDAGRLTKLSMTGVIGVLDGRGPGSTGRTGKALAVIADDRSPVKSRRGRCNLLDPFSPVSAGRTFGSVSSSS